MILLLHPTLQCSLYDSNLGGQELRLRGVHVQCCQAVHTIHEARIVHSDLKPANFLVVEGQLKLIDFGIAKAISSDTTSIAREAQVGRPTPHFTTAAGFWTCQVVCLEHSSCPLHLSLACQME